MAENMLKNMLVLGIETSCDETGVALVQYQPTAKHGSNTNTTNHTSSPNQPTLLAHALHSQIAMHQAFGGVVPELASRDHIRRVLPLTHAVLESAQRTLAQVDVVAYTRGPGLAGALLVGPGWPVRWLPLCISRCWAFTIWKGTCCPRSWAQTRRSFRL